jgi:hypothetical protein
MMMMMMRRRRRRRTKFFIDPWAGNLDDSNFTGTSRWFLLPIFFKSTIGSCVFQ